MKLLRAVSRLSDLGLIASMVALMAIMLLVTVDVILRNLISNSISGAVFLGMAATLKSGHHIAADMLVQTFSIRNQAIVDLLTGLLSFAVMALMALALWAIATGPGASYEVTSVLEIPTQPFWMIASFGIALMCVELLRVVIACIVVLVGEPT
jgi:TRAP-type C4-dicarboxylate transport system permease small subunit